MQAWIWHKLKLECSDRYTYAPATESDYYLPQI